jgi:hypothetical protein
MERNEITDVLDALYRQAKMQHGSLVKGRWFYDRDACPGCGQKISTMKWKKKDALSVNAFMYRDHGVMIAYLLCGKCARHIFKESETNPHGQLPIHDEIEKNLKEAFVQHLGH